MPRYMLDTDIISYIMNRSNPEVLQKFTTLAVSDVCISAITKSELMFGVEVSPRRQKNQAALDAYLLYVEVLDYPGDAALHYAEIRAALKARGALIGANDMLLAAHARHLSLTLVTNNTREFSRVPGLKIENWA
ncbi:MAG: type II toxin-antitoxin system tRNA(fMet)-specific endonuclease VapC [Terracidiphilus sp.]